MRTKRTLNLQTDLSWQTRINFTCVCITAFTISNVFFGPADLLLLYYQHPSVCTGPPVVPVYIQSSPPHTRHTIDFCTDYVLDLWGLFVILGTVFRLSWKPPVRSSSSIHMGDNTVNFCNCIPSLKSSTWVNCILLICVTSLWVRNFLTCKKWTIPNAVCERKHSKWISDIFIFNVAYEPCYF